MGKLLGIISLILALVLFPPATLAVVSNNAIPGDTTYPIKRGLEDVIFAVASLNPATKAWFAAARSDRRFTEVSALVAQGKKASETLNELVEQTQIAAIQIDKVSDPIQKEKLIKQLADSIYKYDVGLSQISTQKKETRPVAIAQPLPTRIISETTPVPVSIATTEPLVPQSTDSAINQLPASSLSPTARPQASQVPQSPIVQSSPTPVPTASSLPSPRVIPSPASVPSPSEDSDIDKARDALEKIKKKLEERQGGSRSQGLEKRIEGRKDDQGKRDESSSRKGREKEN